MATPDHLIREIATLTTKVTEIDRRFDKVDDRLEKIHDIVTQLPTGRIVSDKIDHHQGTCPSKVEIAQVATTLAKTVDTLTVVQSDLKKSSWPTTVKGWLVLVGSFIVIATALWGSVTFLNSSARASTISEKAFATQEDLEELRSLVRELAKKRREQ